MKKYKIPEPVHPYFKSQNYIPFNSNGLQVVLHVAVALCHIFLIIHLGKENPVKPRTTPRKF